MYSKEYHLQDYTVTQLKRPDYKLNSGLYQSTIGKCTGFWWENPKERDHLENQGIDGRMGSERILGNRVDPVGSG
jgi:hypothetical protein